MITITGMVMVDMVVMDMVAAWEDTDTMEKLRITVIMVGFII